MWVEKDLYHWVCVWGIWGELEELEHHVKNALWLPQLRVRIWCVSLRVLGCSLSGRVFLSHRQGLNGDGGTWANCVFAGWKNDCGKLLVFHRAGNRRQIRWFVVASSDKTNKNIYLAPPKQPHGPRASFRMIEQTQYNISRDFGTKEDCEWPWERKKTPETLTWCGWYLTPIPGQDISHTEYKSQLHSQIISFLILSSRFIATCATLISFFLIWCCLSGSPIFSKLPKLFEKLNSL